MKIDTKTRQEILWALEFLQQELEEHHGNDKDHEKNYDRIDTLRRLIAKG